MNVMFRSKGKQLRQLLRHGGGLEDTGTYLPGTGNEGTEVE